MSDLPQEIVSHISIEDEMKRSYLDYAMSVIVSRALPDVRDGLKPVHRRILYAMYEAGYHYNKQYRKSARIVGDVIGKYHPHGDTAVYDSLVRMAQDFSMRIPLVDGQGNFGSIDGDAPAAMRYTESRLTKISHTLLHDIDKNTVDFQPNYDNSEHEPKVLPAAFPNLLVNGSGGIAVGMATNIPPHNLIEVINACVAYIDNPEITIDDIAEIIQGPDFPTSATILGRNAIKSAYHTGKGIIQVRGKASIEDLEKRQAIIIEEIPYAVNKSKMIEKIADLVNEHKITGVSDIRDESDKSGIRVVVEIKKDFSAAVILNQIYSYTPLQTSFGINMVALDHGIPKLMNIKQIIRSFVEFKEEIINKRTIFLLNQARARAHILFALRIAVSNIDEVIVMIRGSQDAAEAKQKLLMKKWLINDIRNWLELIGDKIAEDETYTFSEAQVKSILEMRLQRLTALEHGKIEEELGNLITEIKYFLELLGSRELLLKVMKEELIKVRDEFGTPRLTEIEDSEGSDQEIEDLIQKEDMVVICTLSGYIKRVPLASYRNQKRGGKGRNTVSNPGEDVATRVFVGTTHTPMLFFSSSGQVYCLKLYKIPLGSPQSKGRALVNLFGNLKPGESITNILLLPENVKELENLNIVFSTSSGYIRRNSLDDFRRIPSNGKIAIRLDEGDRLVDVNLCNHEDHVLISTKLGKSIRFAVEDLRVFKSRTSDGVRAIRLQNDDIVISMTILTGADYPLIERDAYLSIPYSDRLNLKQIEQKPLLNYDDIGLSSEQVHNMAQSEQVIFSITSKGYGKCSSAYEYRVTGRGGSGVTNMNISKKTGTLVTVIPIKGHDDELILVTNTGKLIRFNIDTIRVTGRNTSGVILFRITDPKEEIVSAALIADNGENGEDTEV
jgi:DNA gyrase subunit A